MRVRLIALLIFAALLACTLLANYQHKSNEMTIDAQSPGAWPRYAAAPAPAKQGEFIEMRVCHRIFLPRQHPQQVTFT
jgi:hypothetical protein